MCVCVCVFLCLFYGGCRRLSQSRRLTLFVFLRERKKFSLLDHLAECVCVCVCVCVRARARVRARISWNTWPITRIMNVKLLEHTTTPYFSYVQLVTGGPGYRSWHSDWLRAGRSGDRIPVDTRFSTPVQTSPGPTQLSVQFVPCLFPDGNMALAWRWPPPTTSHVALRLKKGYSYTSTLPLGFHDLLEGELYLFCFFTVDNTLWSCGLARGYEHQLLGSEMVL